MLDSGTGSLAVDPVAPSRCGHRRPHTAFPEMALWLLARRKSETLSTIRGHERKGVGFEPTKGPSPINAFQERRIRPLCHPSGALPLSAGRARVTVVT
jgi:hypothetical protein